MNYNIKKSAAFLTIALCLAFGSCKKSSPVPDIIKLMNETTEKIENAKTPEEVNDISTEFAGKLEHLKDDYPDYEPTDEEKKQIVEASIKLTTAASKNYLQNLPDAIDGVDRTAPETAETPGQ